MSILGWIFFGLVAGWIASKIVNRRGEGCILNIALGIAGAVVGGFLFSLLGENIYWGFNLESMFIAILGAVIVLFLYHAATGRRTLR